MYRRPHTHGRQRVFLLQVFNNTVKTRSAYAAWYSSLSLFLHGFTWMLNLPSDSVVGGGGSIRFYEGGADYLSDEMCSYPMQSISIINTMRCDAMRCDAMRCDAMRCDAMRCDAMRCDAMRCDAMRCDAMRCDAMRCDAMRCDAMRCDAMRWMRCDAMRCDAMRCDAMRCDAMRCDAMRCDAMRCDAMRYNSPQPSVLNALNQTMFSSVNTSQRG